MKKLRRKAIEKADAKLYKHEQMKMNKKIFATEFIENCDAEMHTAIKEINDLRENEPKSYEYNLKKAAKVVRLATGYDCVVGFQFAKRISDNVEVLLIHLFTEVKANEHNFFNMYIDDASNIPYLMLKDEVQS